MCPDDAPYFVLFGSAELDIEECRVLIERALAIRFEGHQSSSRGDYYLARMQGGEIFELLPNRDAEGGLGEPSFGEFSVLLYVYGTDRPDAISEAVGEIEGVVKLRSTCP